MSINFIPYLILHIFVIVKELGDSPLSSGTKKVKII